MAIKCQSCGETLPTDPRRAVEENELDRVVGYIRDGEESFAMSQTDWFCNPECLIEWVGEDD